MVEGVMRGLWLGFVLTVAVLFPNVGSAQVYQFRTPPPDVSAAAAAWQINSEPVMVGGLTYYPTRGFRLFDGQVMAQTGMFEGVPVYADMTIEPYSELYVPLGNGRMRVYERRRDRELAGTTGSHAPTFPVSSPSVPPTDRSVATEEAVGTGGSSVPRAVSESALQSIRTRALRIATPRPASGWSSTAHAGTATVPRSPSHPIASSRWVSTTDFRSIVTRPAAATTSGSRW
jgi:hypothetical protein